MNLSRLSPILAKFQFCWFLGPFWAFFPCKKCIFIVHFQAGELFSIENEKIWLILQILPILLRIYTFCGVHEQALIML